jgi:hypothetical protein
VIFGLININARFGVRFRASMRGLVLIIFASPDRRYRPDAGNITEGDIEVAWRLLG